MKLFDPKNINETYRQQLKTELKISDDDFIISYLGSIGGWYLTEEMMQFCKTVSEQIPTAKFLFISPHRHEIITAAATKYGISPEKIIVMHGKRHEVPALLSLSKYSLFFIKPCYSKISSSPTKHGEIMAMGIPVITNSGVGDVDEIVNKFNAGFIIKSFTQQEYKNICKEILSNKTFDSHHIRQSALSFYNLDDAVQKYLSVYNIIFSRA